MCGEVVCFDSSAMSVWHRHLETLIVCEHACGCCSRCALCVRALATAAVSRPRSRELLLLVGCRLRVLVDVWRACVGCQVCLRCSAFGQQLRLSVVAWCLPGNCECRAAHGGSRSHHCGDCAAWLHPEPAAARDVHDWRGPRRRRDSRGAADCRCCAYGGRCQCCVHVGHGVCRVGVVLSCLYLSRVRVASAWNVTVVLCVPARADSPWRECVAVTSRGADCLRARVCFLLWKCATDVLAAGDAGSRCDAHGEAKSHCSQDQWCVARRLWR